MHSLLLHGWLLPIAFGFTLAGFGTFLQQTIPSVTNLLANAGVFGQQTQNRATASPLSPVVNPAITTTGGQTFTGLQQFGTQGIILVFVLVLGLVGLVFALKK